MKNRRISCATVIVLFVFSLSCSQSLEKSLKPRVIISSDIGGTDPDDFQSMIHLLMYADEFQIEGLVSSPYGEGSTKDFQNMVDLYQIDYPQLSAHAPELPSPQSLRDIIKQGGKYAAPSKAIPLLRKVQNGLLSVQEKEVGNRCGYLSGEELKMLHRHFMMLPISKKISECTG